MSTVMNLNIAENLAYGDVEMNRLYYGTDLLWTAPFPPPEVVLWLRGDDFTDSSPKNKTPVINGANGVSIDNALFKYGTGSLLFPYNEGFLSFGSDPDFQFGETFVDAVPFAIEYWGYGTTGFRHWAYSDTESGASNIAFVRVSSMLELRRGPATVVEAPLPSSGQWHHYALTYDKSFFRFFIDGILQDTNDFYELDFRNFFLIGDFFNGNMDSFRVSINNPVYTADFDPETDTGLAY